MLAIAPLRPATGNSQGRDFARYEDIARFVQSAGGRHKIQESLRDNGALLSKLARDAFADSVVAVAMSRDSREIPGFLRSDAVATLFSAANGPQARKYDGAIERLDLIAETAPQIGVRAAAIWALASLEDTTKSISLLAKIASSQNEAASGAVEGLAQSRGARGVAVLRKLRDQEAITEKSAKRALYAWSVHFGWQK